MEVTADKKYLIEVIDRGDFAEWVARNHTGKSAELAKYDYLMTTHYFVYLAMQALEDRKFAKNLHKTLMNVHFHSLGGLGVYLNYLAQFVHAGRWVMYNSENGPSIVKRIWNAIKRLTGFNSWMSMEEFKGDFESFTGCMMKFTTDVEFLKKVIDRTSYVEKAYKSVSERGAELIDEDISTVLCYLNWLGVKALESSERAKNMTDTFKELMEYPSGYVLDMQIRYLYNFVGHGYTLKYGPDNENVVEGLARDFDEFFNRVDINEVQKFKKKLLERQQIERKLEKVRCQAEERREREDENIMYG